MKISVRRVRFTKQAGNRVTSHLALEPHRRQRVDNLSFDENGIFSKRIFGNINRCDCGALNEPGFCKDCQCRVVDPSHMPNFYVDLPMQLPAAFVDFDSAHRYEDGRWNRSIKVDVHALESLASYRSFLYLDAEEGNKFQLISMESLDSNLDDSLKSSDLDQGRILIGVDALLRVGVEQRWIDDNMVDFISIPHPVYRPLVITGNKPFVTPINQMYSDIIKRINVANEWEPVAKGQPLHMLSLYGAITQLHGKIISFLVNELQEAEYSIIKSEIISHPVSGAVRAVVVNRHDVHEDVCIIGDTLVKTLFPHLYRMFDGNMELINRELVERGTLVLANRPPTINHASVVALHPRIASIYPLGHTEGTDLCMKHNEAWCEERRRKLSALSAQMDPEVNLNLGDVETYGQGMMVDPKTGECDGIDTLGLRCVGFNLIMADAMNLDVDGDVMLTIALYGKRSLKEAESIKPSKSYLNYANGTVRNHIIEDFVFADIQRRRAEGDPHL